MAEPTSEDAVMTRLVESATCAARNALDMLRLVELLVAVRDDLQRAEATIQAQARLLAERDAEIGRLRGQARSS